MTLTEAFRLLHHRGYQYIKINPFDPNGYGWEDLEIMLADRETWGKQHDDDYFVTDDKVLRVIYRAEHNYRLVGGGSNTIADEIVWMPSTQLVAECRKPLR